jgi:AraC-like DNA-binding protein
VGYSRRRDCGERHVNLLPNRNVKSVEHVYGGCAKGHVVTEQPTQNITDSRVWNVAKEFEDFVRICGCGQPHLHLLSDADTFSITQRGGRMGSVMLSDMRVGADMSMQCGEHCDAYRVFLVRSGRGEWLHRGTTVGGEAGTAVVYAPDGLAKLQWEANAEVLLFKIDRAALEDALSEALGRQLTTRPNFAPLMPIDTAPGRNWLNMLRVFSEQFFHPDSLLNQPLVGRPFVDSLVHGFLMAADHSYRNDLLGQQHSAAPRAVRTAIDVIEAEAHLPLTLSSIAARAQVSVRSLQQGFKLHLDTSPMSYLRDVRMRRAHQALLESDPSIVTVASVAHDWGFTNLGRFAAAHAARYREPPAHTLRRTA